MCAILGIIGKLPEKEVIIKARDTMTHRGPDDAGLYYSSQEGVALGHRRLSIIDLSTDGRQPFFSHDGRYVIVFNGEIYNYVELKKELENFYEFKTQTDTEVLLAAYIKWGNACLKKLNGMFAFAVWDREKEELFAARDRLGTKPFYYRPQSNTLYFASEIKGLLSLSDFSRKLNKKGFIDFL
ncbi:MAG: asparagine synthetase B, partial [bacterium]|nr:asparagine synthetase B [bacterium]